MNVDRQPLLVHEAGKAFIKTTLSKCESINDGVDVIQKTCGLKDDVYEPAMHLLDVLNVPRNVAYQSIFNEMRDNLISHLSSCTNDNLVKFLDENIRYMSIPELRSVIIAIADKLRTLPLPHLQFVVRNKYLDEMPMVIKRQAWEIDAKLFTAWLTKLISNSINIEIFQANIKIICEGIQGSDKLCRIFASFCLDFHTFIPSADHVQLDMNIINGASLYRDVIVGLQKLNNKCISQYNVINTIAHTINSIIHRKKIWLSVSVDAHAANTGSSAAGTAQNDVKVIYNCMKAIITAQYHFLSNSIQRRESAIQDMRKELGIEDPSKSHPRKPTPSSGHPSHSIPAAATAAAGIGNKKRNRELEDLAFTTQPTPKISKPTSSSSGKYAWKEFADWPVCYMRKCALPQGENIMQVLVDIVNQLQHADKFRTFAEPVTEALAPGYFTVIKQPMDISRMRQKALQKQYPTLMELEKDIYLMLQNARIYNRPGDVVYEDASRLFEYWMKARGKAYESCNAAMIPDPVKDTLIWDEIPQEPISPSSYPTLKPQLMGIYQEVMKHIITLDTQHFFLSPVTEQIAPGYFTVIKQPMDISSIQTKITRLAYPSLMELEKDIYLMLQNARIYNRPGDVVYEAAMSLYDGWNRDRIAYYKRFNTLVNPQHKSLSSTASVTPVTSTSHAVGTSTATADSSATPKTVVIATVASSPDKVVMPVVTAAMSPVQPNHHAVNCSTSTSSRTVGVDTVPKLDTSSSPSSAPVVALPITTTVAPLATIPPVSTPATAATTTAPANPTTATSSAAKTPGEILRGKYEDQLVLLQKEKVIGGSLSQAVQQFAVYAGGSAAGVGNSPGSHLLTESVKPPYNIIPSCLTDFTLKNVLLCFHSTAFTSILARTVINTLFQHCIQPVLKCIMNKTNVNSWKQLKYTLPSSLTDIHVCWQLHTLSKLNSYAEIPLQDDALWSHYLPHVVQFILQYVELHTSGGGSGLLAPNMAAEYAKCVMGYSLPIPATGPIISSAVSATNANASTSSGIHAYEWFFVKLLEASVSYLHKPSPGIA